jgi:hypothetical protein
MDNVIDIFRQVMNNSEQSSKMKSFINKIPTGNAQVLRILSNTDNKEDWFNILITLLDSNRDFLEILNIIIYIISMTEDNLYVKSECDF